MRVRFITDLRQALVVHGPGSAASYPSPTSASWACLWVPWWAIPFPGSSAKWLKCAAGGGISQPGRQPW